MTVKEVTDQLNPWIAYNAYAKINDFVWPRAYGKSYYYTNMFTDLDRYERKEQMEYKPKVGDRVRVLDSPTFAKGRPCNNVVAGDIGVVTQSPDACGDVKIMLEQSQRDYAAGWVHYSKVALVDSESTSTEREPQIGDQVRIRADAKGLDYLVVGEECTITEIEEGDEYPYTVVSDRLDEDGDPIEEPIRRTDFDIIYNHKEATMANAQEVLKNAQLTATDRTLQKYNLEVRGEAGTPNDAAHELVLNQVWAERREAIAADLVAAEKKVAQDAEADRKAIDATIESK